MTTDHHHHPPVDLTPDKPDAQTIARVQAVIGHHLQALSEYVNQLIELGDPLAAVVCLEAFHRVQIEAVELLLTLPIVVVDDTQPSANMAVN